MTIHSKQHGHRLERHPLHLHLHLLAVFLNGTLFKNKTGEVYKNVREKQLLLTNMQNDTFYVNIFVAITSYNKILLTSNICNFTSQCPLAAETEHFEIQAFPQF
jgi:hypothetical protein